jgi:hypothetical protein
MEMEACSTKEAERFSPEHRVTVLRRYLIMSV